MKNHQSVFWIRNRVNRLKLVANAASTGGKKVNGRQRQCWVDTNGFLLRVLVHPADIADTEGGEWLLAAHYQDFPRMQEVRVDSGSKSSLEAWLQTNTSMRLNIIENPIGQKGFAVIPKRWVVERSIAGSGRQRMASREYNRTAEASEAFIYLGSIALVLNRLYPK